MIYRGNRAAFGAPGIEPRWTHSNKQGIGTAYSSVSRLWFTLWNGIVTEAYFPMVDRPQLRDLQYLITDGSGLFQEEKRHLVSKVERLTPHALGYRVTSSDPGGRFVLHKTVITDPHLPVLLLHTRLAQRAGDPVPLTLHALAAPHLELGGWGNNARVANILDQPVLTAEKGGTSMAMAASVPFRRASVGYVGASDGWTDLNEHRTMTWEFDQALDGNVALLGELPTDRAKEFTLGVAFGRSMPSAVATLFQSLGTPFHLHRERFVEQWSRVARHEHPLGKVSGDHGGLFHGSCSLLLAHEDKIFPGAFIASLSIPWGVIKGDEDRGGYHLVWIRDMVNTASALLASGDHDTPLRALIYLATSQQPDGGFPQNFWLTGEPYWQGIQLDEVAYPILLAWRLHQEGALQQFDPYPMVLKAARYLVEKGPATEQERWEELSGYSPSTLAVHVAALVCAGAFARDRGDGATGQFLEEFADFLESHIEAWTVTNQGTLVPGIPRHYIRILPVSVHDAAPQEDPETAVVHLKNRAPGAPDAFPAKEVVDGGFLELVRYGVRRPDDPIVRDSVRVIDEVLKVETPAGPVWHRFNGDGYGQRADGGPYSEYGVGRAWPLLTGERGHYELASGADPTPYVHAMERFATDTGLLPEQVWDEADRPELHLHLGRPTESAMPLAWAHSEYIKLLRSIHDGRIFDQVPEVVRRYVTDRAAQPPVEIWKPNRQVDRVDAGRRLRILGPEPFVLRWTEDGWRSYRDVASSSPNLGIEHVDLEVPSQGCDALEFTFRWPMEDRWEGRNYTVAVLAHRPRG